MRTDRRNFLIKAAVTIPGVAFIGTKQENAQTNNFNSQDSQKDRHTIDDSWLNVRNCGVSGSKFETTAATTIGSRQITVTNIGDFEVGQGIMVSKCNIHYEKTQMWSTGIPYVTDTRPVENSFEVRGYDGSAGSWLIYLLDIAPSSSPAFRWTDDLGRNWHPEVPITHGWQSLNNGVEVRLNQRDWESGYVVTFGVRDQLISRIEKIEGNVLTLKDEATRTVNDAVVRHNDTFALQEAIDHAISNKLNVYVPVGHYMLANTIRVNHAQSITIDGASSEDTIFDISEGEGACLSLDGGTEVTISNLRMIGFMGFDERDKAGQMNTRGSSHVWGFALKPCNGISISDTERVLVQNCHASRMSGECFVSAGHSRGTVNPGQSYSQDISYLRCSVTDSARNAFNDQMCGTENTSILNCHIVNVGGCAWEGASRFVKFIGNYVRNAGTVAIGNLGAANREANQLTPINRNLMYPDVGAGQHIIADNVFESIISYGGCAIRTSRGGTQLIVRNNLFINFNSSAIESIGSGGTNGYASANASIVGNIFDMTCIGQKSQPRAAILVSSNDTIISDNQIYVRGQADQLVTAIRLSEPALNVNVHDNLIRNCGIGIISERGVARISEVIDSQTFLCANWSLTFPLEPNRQVLYKRWHIAWQKSKASEVISVIESFDPDNLSFKLMEPRQMKVGDILEFIAPSLQWNIHDNTVTECLRPLILDSYGSSTSLFKDNLVNCGNMTSVSNGIEVHGRFQILDNHLNGFAKQGAAAFSLYPDAIGRISTSRYERNTFENCFDIITESQPGLWKASMNKDNLAIDCVHEIPR